MTFNADFWIVGGTAAPVIALAAVLAYKDAISELEHIGAFSRRSPRGHAPISALVSGSLAIVTVFVQTAALALALASLADRDNAAPFALVIAMECAGILALAYGIAVGPIATVWRTAFTVGDDPPVPTPVQGGGSDGPSHTDASAVTE